MRERLRFHGGEEHPLMLVGVIAVRNSALPTIEGGTPTPGVAKRVGLSAQTTEISAWVIVSPASAKIASKYSQCGGSALLPEESSAWR